MVLLFVTSLAFRATGREAHEWIGLAFCLLLILHTVWNWGWYKSLLTGRYSARRTLNAITNLALVAAMFALCLCGIMNSRHIFCFSQYVDGENIRQIHSFAAYWGLVLLGIHTGLHWDMIIGAIRKPFGFTKVFRASAFGFRLAAITIVGLGVWASYERDMASKLFLGFSFDFWPPERPLMLFYLCNLAISGVYAVIAHYASQALKTVLRKPSLPVGKPQSNR